MVTIDVPMYINQSSINEASGMKYNTFYDGLMKSMKCDSFSKKWSHWIEEAQWQTPYFTFMVWMSL